MDTTLSGLLGTGRGSEVPTTAVAASLDFLSRTSKAERPDWSFNKAGSAKENREQEILTRSWHCSFWERSLKGRVWRPQEAVAFYDEVTISVCYPFAVGTEVVKHTFRHLHAVRAFMFVIIRVRGRGVRGRLALPLHGDGDITGLQVPTGIITTHWSVSELSINYCQQEMSQSKRRSLFWGLVFC